MTNSEPHNKRGWLAQPETSRTVATLSETFLSRLINELDDETVTAIMLHGSYARGDAIPFYSDVDTVRIVQETSSLLRHKRYIWRDGYLISFSTRPLSVYREWFATPERAIFAVPGVQEARILIDKDGTFSAFQQVAKAFRWEPLQAAADAYASQLLLEQTEMVLKLLRARVLHDKIALMDMTLEIFSATTEAIAVHRGVLITNGNTYYHQVQEAVGRDSTWTHYHNCTAGIDANIVPSIENRSIAALSLYQETVQLLRPHLLPEHREAIEPLMSVIDHALHKEIT